MRNLNSIKENYTELQIEKELASWMRNWRDREGVKKRRPFLLEDENVNV